MSNINNEINNAILKVIANADEPEGVGEKIVQLIDKSAIGGLNENEKMQRIETIIDSMKEIK